LIINASQAGCSVKGSVPRFLSGHNVSTASWSDVNLFKEALEDITPYRFDDAYVTRIDLTNDFHTTHEPESYFPYLDNLAQLNRYTLKNTLYFGGRNNQMCVAIYDKRKHAIHMGYPLSSDEELMRGEVRLQRRSHILKFGLHELSDLQNPSVQIALLERWFNVMNSIQLVNPSSIASGSVNTAKNALEAFAAEHSIEYLKFVEEMHCQGELNEPHNFRRAKQCIPKYKETYYSEPSDHVNEFNQHIATAYTNNLNLISSTGTYMRA
jgi:hypothetical protein